MINVYVLIPSNGRVFRWTYTRKVDLVKSIIASEITKEKAMEIHEISKEEMDNWIESYKKDRTGLSLRIKRKRRQKRAISSTGRVPDFQSGC